MASWLAGPFGDSAFPHRLTQSTFEVRSGRLLWPAYGSLTVRRVCLHVYVCVYVCVYRREWAGKRKRKSVSGRERQEGETEIKIERPTGRVGAIRRERDSNSYKERAVI